MQNQQQILENKLQLSSEHIEFSIGKEAGRWFKTIRDPLLKGDIILASDHEFEVHLTTSSGEEKPYSDADCLMRSFSQKANRIEFMYEERHGYFEAFVTYDLMQGAYLRKRVSIKPLSESVFIGEIIVDRVESLLPAHRGGEGQPVFIEDQWFMGIEFPFSLNETDGVRMSFRHRPGMQIGCADKWHSYPLVYGSGEGIGLENAFREYVKSHQIRQAGKPISIYCDWGLHDELSDGIELTEQITVEMLDHLVWMKETYDMAFDYYLIDAFWFQEDGNYKAFKTPNWPRGFEAVREQIRSQDMKLGLWFDVNASFLKSEQLNQARMVDGQYGLCLAHPQYVEMLKEALLYHIREHDLKMIKFDFAEFYCANPGHNHFPDERSREFSAARFLEMMEQVRAEAPELVVLAYNGFTANYEWIKDVDRNKNGWAVSPWWAFHMDYIYCGDPRPSEIPALRLRDSIHAYTDAMIRQFHDSLLPYGVVDDHGAMVGDTGTIYKLGKEGWRNDWILGFSRGNGKSHFYGDLKLLDENDYIFMKKTALLMEESVRKGFVTHAILGNPVYEEIYGYHNGNQEEGYITIVNPYPATAEVKPEWASTNPWLQHGDCIIYTRIYEQEQWLDEDRPSRYISGHDDVIFVAPFSVTMLKWERILAYTPPISDHVSVELAAVSLLQPGLPVRIPIKKPVGNDDYFVFRYKDSQQKPYRTEQGILQGLVIELTVNGTVRKLNPLYDSAMWSGISWMVYRAEGEWAADDDAMLTLHCESAETIQLQIELWVSTRGR